MYLLVCTFVQMEGDCTFFGYSNGSGCMATDCSIKKNIVASLRRKVGEVAACFFPQVYCVFRTFCFPVEWLSSTQAYEDIDERIRMYVASSDEMDFGPVIVQKFTYNYGGTISAMAALSTSIQQ